MNDPNITDEESFEKIPITRIRIIRNIELYNKHQFYIVYSGKGHNGII